MSSKGTMKAAEGIFDGNPNKERKESEPKFANLQDQKRGSGQSSTAEANRQSFTEQTKTEGSLGAMWDKYAVVNFQGKRE